MITPSYSITATERVLPRLALDFTTGILDSRVTIARLLNTATRVNSSGLIESVNANLPRFDYDPVTLAPKGLLIEEARTNLLLRSEEFDNATWAKSAFATVTANTTSAPSGATTADTLAANTATTANPAEVFQAQTLAVSTQYAYSMFAKKNTSNFIALRHTAVLGNPYAWFNLNTGTVGTVQAGLTATITPFGNGWYRCTVVGTTAAVIGVNRVDAIVSDNDGNYVCASGGSIFLYGADLEAGAFATSYIPTTTTSLTRNADRVSMTGTNFSSWYNASSGTIAVQGDTLTVSNSNSMTICSFLLNSSNVTRFWMWSGQPANLRYNIVAGGATSAEIVKAITANTRFNAVGSYKTDLFQYALNGGATTADASGAVPTGLTAFYIGSLDSVNEPLSGHIAKINFYSQSLTSNEVQAFSK